MSDSFCMDCGKAISSRYHKRCNRCATLARWGDEQYRAKTIASIKERARSRPKTEVSTSTRLKMSEATRKRWTDPTYKKRVSDSNSKAQIGKPRHDDARKAELSAAAKAQWSDPDYVAKQTASRWSNEHRQKRSEQAKRLWDQGVYGTDGWRKKQGIAAAARLSVFSSPSSVEGLVARALDELGVRYLQQFQPDGYWRVYDFLLPDYSMLLEVDGDYWHHSEFAERKGAPAVDAEKDDWALNHGYSIARVLESQIMEYGAHDLLYGALQEYEVEE